jgi:hypothetical protein
MAIPERCINVSIFRSRSSSALICFALFHQHELSVDGDEDLPFPDGGLLLYLGICAVNPNLVTASAGGKFSVAFDFLSLTQMARLDLQVS